MNWSISGDYRSFVTAGGNESVGKWGYGICVIPPPLQRGEENLRYLSFPSPSLWEREEFQVELGRNLEIRVRGLNNKKLTPRPITALTSQVGEVAVVRTPESYKCGWGLNNVKSTPTLTLPAGEGTRVVARLAHIPRPQKITSLRG